MPRAEMLNRMSSRELTEWQLYAHIEPFGEDRADLRAGTIASTVANTARDPKKQRDPFKPTDFMPFHEEPEPTDEERAQKIMAVLGWPGPDGDTG